MYARGASHHKQPDCVVKMLKSLMAISTLSMLMATSAQAAVVNFENLSDHYFPSSKSFSDNGVSIRYNDDAQTGFAQIDSGSSCDPSCATNGTNAFYSFNTGSLTLGLKGSTFSLIQFDAAQTFTTLDRPLDLTVTGVTTGGLTVTGEFLSAPGTADSFQTFQAGFPFNNLTSVTFSGTGSYPTTEFALDNVVLSTVPLPASAPMFGAAILVLGTVGHRLKRRKAAAA